MYHKIITNKTMAKNKRKTENPLLCITKDNVWIGQYLNQIIKQFVTLYKCTKFGVMFCVIQKSFANFS